MKHLKRIVSAILVTMWVFSFVDSPLQIRISSPVGHVAGPLVFHTYTILCAVFNYYKTDYVLTLVK